MNRPISYLNRVSSYNGYQIGSGPSAEIYFIPDFQSVSNSSKLFVRPLSSLNSKTFDIVLQKLSVAYALKIPEENDR